MKKILLSALLLACTTLCFAQEDKQPSAQPTSKELAAIRMANNLARYGYDNYSPSALIEAARILVETPTQPLQAESVEKGASAQTEEAKSEKVEYTPANLLADAKKFADGDVTMLALAAKVEKLSEGSVSRGRVGGPGRTVTKVAAGGTDTFTIKFWKNELAEILVSGDGDTDLDLYVYDENGNVIEYDDDYSDDCYVSWIPKWTGTFIVKVVNRGRVYNQYVMLTN